MPAKPLVTMLEACPPIKFCILNLSLESLAGIFVGTRLKMMDIFNLFLLHAKIMTQQAFRKVGLVYVRTVCYAVWSKCAHAWKLWSSWVQYCTVIDLQVVITRSIGYPRLI